jgi:small-conductance mechanosensitive channel
MEQFPEFFSGLTGFLQSLPQVQNMWQAPVLLAALALGAGASATLGRQLSREAEDRTRVQRLRGIVFALVAVTSIALLGRFFGMGRPAPLLHMAAALALALVVARVGVYVLNHVVVSSAHTVAWQTFFVRTVWILFALYIIGLLSPIMELLQDIGLPIGNSYVSLLQVLQAVIIVAAVLVLALWLSGAMERRLARSQTLDPTVRVIVSKLLRGLLIFLAVVIALPAVGIDSTFLSVLGGALGVGLGFGLQKIASNYVSGFIILLDRSVRLGDVITIEGRQGTVIQLEARCTTLSATDGTTFIVPNETFMIHSVINHTRSGLGVLRSIAFEVAHGSDLSVVQAIGEAAIRAQGRVLNYPAPVVNVTRLSGHGVEMSLQFWIADPGVSDNALRSAILQELQAGLRAAQIKIPLTDGSQAVLP